MIADPDTLMYAEAHEAADAADRFLTANDAAIRRMGAAAWQRLHRLAYLAALAGALHFLLLVKTLTPSAVLHAGAILMLLALR
ncbi:MAG: hypothetical protein CVT83_03990, partial [Alphaproteobacteria bacterium HGW-Alphaproteobacteria-5]